MVRGAGYWQKLQVEESKPCGRVDERAGGRPPTVSLPGFRLFSQFHMSGKRDTLSLFTVAAI